MVQHPYINQRQRGFERLGQGFISPGRLHRATGVVVGQHHGTGLVVQGAQYHLAGVDAGLRQRDLIAIFHQVIQKR